MTERPSDRAIAQAFWELLAAGTGKRTVFGCMLHIENRAREIDAAAGVPHLDAVRARLSRSGVFKVGADAAAPEGAQGAVVEAGFPVDDHRTDGFVFGQDMDAAIDAARGAGGGG